MSDIPYVRSSVATVQVSVADQRLRVFDSAQRRWRHVCSSGANQLLAAISCEEMGFVRWPEEKTLREQIERKNDVAENGQKNHLWVVVFSFLFQGNKFLRHVCSWQQQQWPRVLLRQRERVNLRQEDRDSAVSVVRLHQGWAMWPWYRYRDQFHHDTVWWVIAHVLSHLILLHYLYLIFSHFA